MRNAKRFYNALLTLYPHGYRKAFGAQMMQTFLDYYADVETSEGRVSAAFWLSAITDEIKNIAEQRMASPGEGNKSVKITAFQGVVSAGLFFPLYAVFYAALVKISLALPHPPVSGIGFLIALTGLFLIPGVLSVVTGCVIANALMSVFPAHKSRSA